MLPRWARVAFAARCARLVQPLYLQGWPQAPQADLDTLNNTINLAEASAADASSSNVTFASVSAAESLVDTEAEHGGFYPARTAAHAVTAAYADTTATAGYASFAAQGAAIASDHSLTAAIRQDYELLFRLATEENWDCNTPVPPEVFEPVMPDEAPD